MVNNLVKVRQIDLPKDLENGADLKLCINRCGTNASNNVYIDSGFLWRASTDKAEKCALLNATLYRSIEFDSLQCTLFPGEGKLLSVEQARILLALPIDQRAEFYLSESFAVATLCRVGNTVLVRDPEARRRMEPTASLKCTVRFKGILPSRTQPKDPDGLYFGFVCCDAKVDDGQPMLMSELSEYHTYDLLQVRRDEERNRRVILADARWLVPDERFAAEHANAGHVDNRGTAGVHYPPDWSPPPPPPNATSFDERRHEAEKLMKIFRIDIGSYVNVTVLDKIGIVMWYGFIPGEDGLIVGVTLDDDGVADRGGAGFVPASRVLAAYPDVQQDLWFAFFDVLESCNNSDCPRGADALPVYQQPFDNEACMTIVGDTLPRIQANDLDKMIGRNHGVQGHHNSCYLDSTLFAMFATVDAFDDVLSRPAKPKDLDNYDEIRGILREGIVNCLRHHKFVSAQQVLKLRKCLNDLEVIPGMMNEEKDPEEFINLLLDHALRHEPFIKLSTGQSCHVLQLFLDRADLPFEQQQQKQQQQSQPQKQQGGGDYIADTETLLHLSLIQSNIQLSEPPKCLILQMPRSGKSYKMFHRILPVLQLNITNLLPDTARACGICGGLATVECHQCFLKHDSGRDYTYCDHCYNTFADHKKGNKHRDSVRIKYPRHIEQEYAGNKKGIVDTQTVMDLLAVVCIRTSHYVCFLRAEPDNWLFFDSMADREGGLDGHNIPEVTRVPGVEVWLDKLKLKDCATPPPEQVNRLLEDCYLCFYGNPRNVKQV